MFVALFLGCDDYTSRKKHPHPPHPIAQLANSGRSDGSPWSRQVEFGSYPVVGMQKWLWEHAPLSTQVTSLWIRMK